MDLQTPIVVTIRTREWAGRVDEQGRMWVPFRLASSIQLNQAHTVKLLYVWGTTQPLLCYSSLVRPQAVDESRRDLLGTSFPQCNVYLPVNGNFFGPAGWLCFENMDGTPINKYLDLVCAFHLDTVR